MDLTVHCLWLNTGQIDLSSRTDRHLTFYITAEQLATWPRHFELPPPACASVAVTPTGELQGGASERHAVLSWTLRSQGHAWSSSLGNRGRASCAGSGREGGAERVGPRDSGAGGHHAQL